MERFPNRKTPKKDDLGASSLVLGEEAGSRDRKLHRSYHSALRGKKQPEASGGFGSVHPGTVEVRAVLTLVAVVEHSSGEGLKEEPPHLRNAASLLKFQALLKSKASS